MADPEKALATQLANIEKRTGKSIAQLTELIHASGLAKHGEMVAMLKTTLGLGHGDANTLVHHSKQAAAGTGAARAPEDVLDRIYTGPKAALRPIHDVLMTAIRGFGPFEEAPKQTYVSLRRKKQFAMIGPATNSRVEVGLNLKNLEPTERLLALPPGQMCSHKVRLTDVTEADAELLGWIRAAYEAAG